MTDDPFALLGLDPSATTAELSAARRRMAQELHPDHGGDASAMQELNAAYEEAARRVAARVAAPFVAAPPAPGAPVGNARGGRRTIRGVQHDAPSFTIDVLPVEAHEALLVVTSWMGEVLVDDPPYLLEVFLHDPSPCWCRLDLVPDAGATTVSLMVAAIEGDPAPDIDDVRDVWVANLNRLGDL